MQPDLKDIASLSKRQKEVLRLSAQHHQAKEIARLLKISENTVKTHMVEARRRLGGITTKQAIRLFLEKDSLPALILEGGDPEEVIPGPADSMPVWFHEQALHTPTTAQRDHDDQFRGSGDGLANAGSSQQARSYPGLDRHVENAEPNPRARESNFQHGRRQRLVDGRWGEFRRRLINLPAIQLLGLIVLAAVALALIAGMLVTTLLGMVEVVHKLTFYAGWKS